MQHQISNATKYDRYPIIFKECINYFKDKSPKILSFGCSNGTEVKTLRELYFKDSIIHGVDISHEMISACNNLNLDNNILFFHSDEVRNETYDLIFCMSVLCRWPQTQFLKDCSTEYTFDQFESQLIQLDKQLNPGGLLVIYNSNFMLSDSFLSNTYEPLICNSLNESGFVKKFTKENKEFLNNYKYSIFIKNTH